MYPCAFGQYLEYPTLDVAPSVVADSRFDLFAGFVGMVKRHFWGRHQSYAAHFAVAVFSLAFAGPHGRAAELLASVQLVNAGAVFSCDYASSNDTFTFTCRDAYTEFALRCVSVAWSALSIQRAGQQEFLCPVSADRSAFGNALRLRCSAYGAASRDELYARDALWRTAPTPRLLVEGRMPTHNCHSDKVDVE
jgi:hypothetical protein